MAATKTETEAKTVKKTGDISINRKLLEIQNKLFVPKENRNEYGGYNYRTCEDIEKAVKPLCMEYNCTLVLYTEIVPVLEKLFVKAKATLYDNDSEVSVSVSAYAEISEEKRGNMSSEQKTGSAISFARKYAMAGMFLIDNEKDPDVLNDHKDVPVDKINATQIKAIKAELDRTGVSESVILDSVKKKALKDLTQADYVTITQRLNVTPGKEQ